MSAETGTGKRKVPVHYLRGNDSEWTPPQVIFFDTESRQVVTEHGETHYLRLWAARLDSRRPDSTGWRGTLKSWGTTAGQLAAHAEEWCRGQRCVWAFAHNLSFDLIVSQLPAQLGELGWEVTDHAAGSETPWLRMRKGDCTLTLADSWGWLRQPVAAIASAVGMTKPPLPDNASTQDEWRARCEADRDILATAMLSVLDWWDSAGMGRWSLTGSHTGWNAMRHMMARRRVTIIPDPEGIAADRKAIYGGRRECYQWGDITGGPFAEYDFTAAYPTIAASFPLPAKRVYAFDSLPLDSPLARGIGLGIIADAEIETGSPRWPCRIGGRVWYPAGRFITTLATPEIAEAEAAGALRAIHRGYAHAMGWFLQHWAEWILAGQKGRIDGIPAAAVPMVKHWGRAVIGKFAAHGFSKEAYGETRGNGWSYLPVWDIAAQAPGAIVELGGKRWKCLSTESGDNCYPAVLAFVESHTRAMLSRVIAAAPGGVVIACDTDGVLIRDGQAPPAGQLAQLTAPLVLRRKESYAEVRVLGPQHQVRDGQRKYSGVPGSAVARPDGALEALTWPKLAWQLREQQGGGYRRPPQRYTVGQSYASGWVDESGAVLPVEVRLGAGGANVPVPWSQTSHAAAGRVLGPVQAPAVERVFGR